MSKSWRSRAGDRDTEQELEMCTRAVVGSKKYESEGLELEVGATVRYQGQDLEI